MKHADFLASDDVINFQKSKFIDEVANNISANAGTTIDKVEQAYIFVRDNIKHSLDINANTVTCTASEVLAEGHGFCYAKSHLLAAVLRSMMIPTGLCYQKLFNEEDGTFCLHGLNAVYIPELDKWIKLDARGNKPGVNAQFSLDKEILAYPTRAKLGEVLYDKIYPYPEAKVLEALKNSPNCNYLVQHLPETL